MYKKSFSSSYMHDRKYMQHKKYKKLYIDLSNSVYKLRLANTMYKFHLLNAIDKFRCIMGRISPLRLTPS